MSDDAGAPAVEGNQQKFAWIYELMSDTSLSAAAKTVGVGTALKMAGRKGYFKATRKAISSLCGMSLSTINRAFVELAAQYYWGIEYKIGGANVYTLIMPERRLELWLASESKYDRQVRKWLFEEERIWLDAERAFKLRTQGEPVPGGRQLPVLEAADDKTPCQIRGGGLSDPGRGVVSPDKGGLSDPGMPLVKANPVTSGNDQTHKSFERSLKETERSLKDRENDHASLRAPDGTRSARSCALCDDDGVFIDPDGLPVVLLENTDCDDFKELTVKCRHSLDANLAEIQRIELESEGYWGLAKTGWHEIDRHYPMFCDDDCEGCNDLI